MGESQSAQSSQSITVGESQEEQDEQVLSAERIPTEDVYKRQSGNLAADGDEGEDWRFADAVAHHAYRRL